MKEEKETHPELAMLGQRIKEIRLRLGNMSQREFAREIGLSHSYMSGVEKGRNSPGFSFYYNIATKFKVSLYYLFFGKGDIFLENEGHIPEIHLETTFGTDSAEIKEMLWYMEHSKLVRHSILSVFAKFLYENQENIVKDIQRTKEKQHTIESLESNANKNPKKDD
ncbi:MAG: helix-turn-helix domain-containing protein [Candidatus Aminicenantes bacterium]|nr:helix-turn-helix domain-containing protein [Candidatus Aminicenantes bacterium]NIM82769.1 helix-turn-helix domain-containing protein [Candidatus Aminicenantes bacterium]NIN22144.1 helix-turn-helix domain-containing protein [Candidatus Aminicenantes bacterium]NIN45901.1 helix-turn-helix domain-containing protein [Candidatus Aminicenantes bacterium]NIN88740.1 helix-turn-helix domain-containing protein [Candidatus Aminicenantes bacterium]